MALPIWAIYMRDLYDDDNIGIPEDANFERPSGYNGDVDCASAAQRRMMAHDSTGLSFPSADDLDGWE